MGILGLYCLLITLLTVLKVETAVFPGLDLSPFAPLLSNCWTEIAILGELNCDGNREFNHGLDFPILLTSSSSLNFSQLPLRNLTIDTRKLPKWKLHCLSVVLLQACADWKLSSAAEFAQKVFNRYSVIRSKEEKPSLFKQSFNSQDSFVLAIFNENSIKKDKFVETIASWYGSIILEATLVFRTWEIIATKQLQDSMIVSANVSDIKSIQDIQSVISSSVAAYYLKNISEWSIFLQKGTMLDVPCIVNAPNPSTLLNLNELKYKETHLWSLVINFLNHRKYLGSFVRQNFIATFEDGLRFGKPSWCNPMAPSDRFYSAC